MKLYFVRHGKTEYNQRNIFQGGGVDSPLLAEGIKQAKQAGVSLADTPFSAVYSSPQKRARDTAAYIIAENSCVKALPIQIEEDLREIEFGKWDGLPIKVKQDELEFKHLRSQPEFYNPKAFAGESYPALIDRSVACLKKIIDQQSNEANLLIVSHGVLLTSLVKTLFKVPINEFRKEGLLGNASITVLETNDEGGSFSIIRWNDTSCHSN